MKKYIQELLKQTPHVYEMKNFELWFRWCQSVTAFQKEFQMVLSNPAVNRWFHAELVKQEAEFLDRVKNYPNATLQDLHEQYHACIVQLFNYYPKPLLEDIRKVAVKETVPPTPKAFRTEKHTINQFQLN